MRLLGGFWETAAKGASAFRFGAGWGGLGSYAGGGYGLAGLLGQYQPGSQYNYAREAGPLWMNSIVLACLKWQSRAFRQARPIIEREDADGEREEVPDHPALALLERPNPHYPASVLWDGVRTSLAVNGNAYVYINRSRMGTAAELLYLPHMQVEPVWSRDGLDYISGYAYRVDGLEQILAPEDVIHYRDGIDPSNQRKGLSPLAAVLREVCTDNEAATYAAALLRNQGIPGVIISPKAELLESDQFTADKADAFKQMWTERTTGDRRGLPIMPSLPVDINVPAFDPGRLLLDKVRDIPEERITAALGIPSPVVGMGSGMDSSTYNNVQTYLRLAWENNIIPAAQMIDEPNTERLLPLIPGTMEGDRCGRDLSGVQALRENETELHARWQNDYQKGVAKRSEARRALGLDVDEAADDVYYTDLLQQRADATAQVLAARTQQQGDGNGQGGRQDDEQDGAGLPEKALALKRQAASLWRR